jgi:hypothetical protein
LPEQVFEGSSAVAAKTETNSAAIAKVPPRRKTETVRRDTSLCMELIQYPFQSFGEQNHGVAVYPN